MAITSAKGTVLNFSDIASPPVYAPIGQVRSIAGPTVKPNIVDITTHDTVGFNRKKVANRAAVRECFIPGSCGDARTRLGHRAAAFSPGGRQLCSRAPARSSFFLSCRQFGEI